jgi:sigma-B regulation protein RsbU (phosphoserine phosphatase)
MELVITLTDGTKTVHELGPLPEVIGRERTCDIFVDEPSTSRRHARFTPTSDGYLVEDLRSKNGTQINGEPCDKCIVRHGDRITVGSVEIECRDAADSASVTSVIVAEDDLAASRATRYASRSPSINLSQRRLQMIYDLSERLVMLQGQEELLQEVLAVGFETLQFERGAVGVRTPGRRTVDWPVVRNLRGAEGELTVSGTMLRRALEHGERAIFTDEGTEAADPTVSIVQHGIRSAMCVPLTHGEEVLGVIYGDRTSTATTYSQEDIDFLAAIARQASIGLINCRLVEEQKELVRLNHDIDFARRIQTELFPTGLPDRAGMKVAALNEPGNRVSGDYYDVIETRDGRLWLLIADVMGEGVASALLMANLQAAVRATIEGQDNPGALLVRWNDLICKNTRVTKFVTCLLALINPGKQAIRFASAGHHLPLVYRGQAEEPVVLDYEPGFPLGVVEGAEFPTCDIPVEDDSFLFVAYTDGVIEAMNTEQEQFGTDRFLDTLLQTRALSPQSIVKRVRKAVSQYAGGAAQSDDITLLAAKIGE